MTCGLVNASYSLPEWQAVKLTLFAPWSIQEIQEKTVFRKRLSYLLQNIV